MLTNVSKCDKVDIVQNKSKHSNRKEVDCLTDTALLEHEIEMSGLKKAFIATSLGMTPQTFRSKSINNSDFTTSEVNKLCILLGINDLDKKEQIFFASDVANK